ncbi:MAG: DNA repair protein RadA, partial [Fluviibacter sp.]
MAKLKTLYTCTECGSNQPKWQGQCPDCNAWNTLVETVAEKAAASAHRFASLAPVSGVQALGKVEAREAPRLSSGIDEFDRFLGGGLVSGGVALIGGDPGIGKSTLLLQCLAAVS